MICPCGISLIHLVIPILMPLGPHFPIVTADVYVYTESLHSARHCGSAVELSKLASRGRRHRSDAELQSISLCLIVSRWLFFWGEKTCGVRDSGLEMPAILEYKSSLLRQPQCKTTHTSRLLTSTDLDGSQSPQ